MVDVDAIRNAQRAEGTATIMAIGTAVPPNSFNQSEFADYYFRITNSEHKTKLKETFKNMCEKSMVKKRHFHLTEEILKENPNMCAFMAPSLDARQAMVVVEVPKLGKEAAVEAIKEWGQPKSKITHLIFSTMTGLDMPGADYQLIKLLGLQSSVKRVMLYQQGCFAGVSALRIAKDLAENNKGARVLVICCEITAILFRGPSETHVDNLPAQAMLGDGASAMIVGADPVPGIEKPLFQLVSATQTIIPDSEGSIELQLTEAGLTFHLRSKLTGCVSESNQPSVVKSRKTMDVASLVSEDIDKSLVEAFEPLGISNWNSLFWITHPGGPAIMNQIEAKLGLKPEKLQATRHILSEYGNMTSATVLFILNEMRNNSAKKGLKTTGEGLEWGVLFGIGPGITLETMVLRSVQSKAVTGQLMAKI